MKKTNQDKFLKELIKRVIQKDIDIQNRHEKEAVENATKEALIEMTEMSLEEINEIETRIRLDNFQKQEKRRKRIIFIVIISIITVVFVYFYFKNHIKGKVNYKESYKDSLVFDENFNDNSNNWIIYEEETKNSEIKDGQYIFQVKDNKKCKYSMISKRIKANSQIKLTSIWISGEDGFYGLKLEETKKDFYVFEINADRRACIVKQINGKNKIRYFDLDINYFDDGKTSVEQTIILKDKLIEYYVNDELIHVEKDNKLTIRKIGLSICKYQTVAFDKLQVWE